MSGGKWSPQGVSCTVILRIRLATMLVYPEMQQLISIRLHLLQGNEEAEVVIEKKLQLEVVELGKGNTTNLELVFIPYSAYLCISRVRVKHIRRKFARNRDGSNN